MSHATRLAAASRMVAALGDLAELVDIKTPGRADIIAVDIDTTAPADDTVAVLMALLDYCDTDRAEAQARGSLILTRCEGTHDVLISRGYSVQVVPS